jgi:hypothetical protein
MHFLLYFLLYVYGHTHLLLSQDVNAARVNNALDVDDTCKKVGLTRACACVDDAMRLLCTARHAGT